MKQWITNIKTWYASLSGFVKAVTFIATFAGSVYGGVIAYNHFVINKYTQHQAIEVRDRQLDTIIKYFADKKVNDVNFQNEIFIKLAHVSDSLRLVNTNINQLTYINANLKQWLLTHASTKDDVNAIWKLFDTEKKNGTGYSFNGTVQTVNK